MEKKTYLQPKAEIIYLKQPLTLLLDFSADGTVGDFEGDGDL